MFARGVSTEAAAANERLAASEACRIVSWVTAGRRRQTLAGFGVGALVFLARAEPARAEPKAESRGEPRYRTPIFESTAYYRGFVTLSLGDGVRFNNPYRLPTEIGDGSESLSRSAAFYDLGLGFVRGPAEGLAHGAVLHLSIAAEGIPQQVLSASYCMFERLGRGEVFGRAGVPIVFQPDTSAGLELGFGGLFWLRAGIGVHGELAGSLFYGAATPAHSVSTIPVLSGTFGILVAYEVLP